MKNEISAVEWKIKIKTKLLLESYRIIWKLE